MLIHVHTVLLYSVEVSEMGVVVPRFWVTFALLRRLHARTTMLYAWLAAAW
jgi:hypothetical protein